MIIIPLQSLNIFQAASAVDFLEFLHEVDKSFDAGKRHSIVNAGSYAARGTVYLETDHAFSSSFLDKLSFELFGRKKEDNGNLGTDCRIIRILVEAG